MLPSRSWRKWRWRASGPSRSRSNSIVSPGGNSSCDQRVSSPEPGHHSPSCSTIASGPLTRDRRPGIVQSSSASSAYSSVSGSKSPDSKAARRRSPTGPKGTMAAMLSPSVQNLVAQLTRLPGVGTRTAQRLTFHLLRAPKAEALALAEAIADVKERVRFCAECGNLTEDEICEICSDARRDRSLVCVVEQPADLVSLERTAEYRGLYHVLGGALSPLDGVDPGDLRIDELVRRVERDGIEEVVLATNPNMTGEATAAFIADRLRGRVRVTRLASGLPVGGDLEYADEVTLGRALVGRRDM